jgi:hypothetical protein
VHERDRDSLDALGREERARLADVLLHERRQLLAGVVGALGRAHAEVTGHERRGRLETIVVRRLAQPVAEGERVAEAPRREEGRRRAPPRQHRVRGHGRAVHHHLGLAQERARVHAELRRDPLEPGDEAHRRIVGGRARLVDEPEVVGADQEEVGERPADVDADPVAHAPPRSRAVSASSTLLPSGSTATP